VKWKIVPNLFLGSYDFRAEEEEILRRTGKGLSPESDDSDIEPPDELA
jgi:hypothetical protein